MTGGTNGLVTLLMLIAFSGLAQHKIDESKAYNITCFMAMKKTATYRLIDMKNALYKGDRSTVLRALRLMKKSMKEFDLSDQKRSFQLWYQGNYTDFEDQVLSARSSTLATLEHFERKFKRGDMLYYDRRQFLELYLSFVGEYYHPNFWFMTVERYFSRQTVARIRKDNAKEIDLFSNSSLFEPYDPLNQLAMDESKEVEQYLRIDSLNAGYDFQPYIYLELKPNRAATLLDRFHLNKYSLDISTDRQVAALEDRLKDLSEGKILLIVRYNKFLVGLR